MWTCFIQIAGLQCSQLSLIYCSLGRTSSAACCYVNTQKHRWTVHNAECEHFFTNSRVAVYLETHCTVGAKTRWHNCLLIYLRTTCSALSAMLHNFSFQCSQLFVNILLTRPHQHCSMLLMLLTTRYSPGAAAPSHRPSTVCVDIQFCSDVVQP